MKKMGRAEFMESVTLQLEQLLRNCYQYLDCKRKLDLFRSEPNVVTKKLESVLQSVIGTVEFDRFKHKYHQVRKTEIAP